MARFFSLRAWCARITTPAASFGDSQVLVSIGYLNWTADPSSGTTSSWRPLFGTGLVNARCPQRTRRTGTRRRRRQWHTGSSLAPRRASDAAPRMPAVASRRRSRAQQRAFKFSRKSARSPRKLDAALASWRRRLLRCQFCKSARSSRKLDAALASWRRRLLRCRARACTSRLSAGAAAASGASALRHPRSALALRHLYPSSQRLYLMSFLCQVGCLRCSRR